MNIKLNPLCCIFRPGSRVVSEGPTPYAGGDSPGEAGTHHACTYLLMYVLIYSCMFSSTNLVCDHPLILYVVIWF